MSAELRFWILTSGLGVTIGTLIRMTFLMGGLVREFRLHVEDSRATHSDQELRLRTLEHGRKPKRARS
jgi:hypothetical protein